MKTIMHKYLLTISIMIVSSLLIGNCVSETVSFEPKTTHKFELEEDSLQLKWSLNKVYVLQNDFETMMSASSGYVCILGDFVYPSQNDLSCLTSGEGTVAWQKILGTPTGILMDSDGIYVSYGGIAGINKFDYEGRPDWSLSTINAGVQYLYLYKNQLQLFMLPERFMILERKNGNHLEDIKGESIIYKTETERFVINYSLESRSLDLKEVNWRSDISSNNIRLAPLFTDNLILVRTGRVLGTLLALDRTTGQISWKTENTIVSNIVYWPTKSSLFALTKSGQLLKINIDSGEQSVLLSFSPGPFVLNGDTDAIVGGYELALDESNNILFILLGDSRQLFAFKLE